MFMKLSSTFLTALLWLFLVIIPNLIALVLLLNILKEIAPSCMPLAVAGYILLLIALKEKWKFVSSLESNVILNSDKNYVRIGSKPIYFKLDGTETIRYIFQSRLGYVILQLADGTLIKFLPKIKFWNKISNNCQTWWNSLFTKSI
jgi:hypothetical protein